MPPRKERPSALSDSIFKAKLDKAAENVAGHVAGEIPVHNTFIQFGAPPSVELEKKPLSTAPAWIGPSLQSMLQQVEQPTTEAECFEDEASISPENLLLGSPKKIPVMQYSLSTSSARAAGLPGWSPTKVATVGAAQILCGLDKDLLLDDGIEDEVESTNGTHVPSELRTSGAPSSPSGPLPSMGSAQHAEGACKRCCFFPKGRCQNGYNCEFCHFEHEKRKRKKKKKGAAGRRDSAGSESEDESETDLPGTDPSAQQNSTATGPSNAESGRASKPEPSSQRAGLPLTAPPLLPPRGLPLPSEPPPPAPNPVHVTGHPPLSADQYYGGGYDSMPPGVARAAPPYTGYGGAYVHPNDARLAAYYGGGYDPGTTPAAYQQPPPGRYLPPPR